MSSDLEAHVRALLDESLSPDRIVAAVVRQVALSTSDFQRVLDYVDANEGTARRIFAEPPIWEGIKQVHVYTLLERDPDSGRPCVHVVIQLKRLILHEERTTAMRRLKTELSDPPSGDFGISWSVRELNV